MITSINKGLFPITIFVRRVFAIEIGQLNAKQSSIIISKTFSEDNVRKVDSRDIIILNRIVFKVLQNTLRN